MSTIKLRSLSRWNRLDNAEAIMFNGPEDRERHIRLHVNVLQETPFFVQGEDGENRLLAVVPPGLSVIDFYAAGKIGVFVQEHAEVWFQTAEHEPTHREVLDPVVFTKIIERRARNPELEAVMYRAELNAQRRYAQQREEIDALFKARMRELEDARTQAANHQGTTDAASAGHEAAAGGGTAKPAQAAGKAAGSKQAGGDVGSAASG